MLLFLKPGCLEWKNASLGYQILNLCVLKIKLSFVRKVSALMGWGKEWEGCGACRGLCSCNCLLT